MTDTRVAVVTGAASGIGAATALMLRDRGWRVAGLDLDESDADVTVKVDVTDAHAVAEAIAHTERALGPIDSLVHAAGAYEMAAVEQITEERWCWMLDLHLGGLVNSARCVLPSMVDRGRGQIVAMSSAMAVGGGASDVHHAAAMGAVVGMVRSLAHEVAEHGVRVNCVAPGATDTPLLAPDSPWRDAAYVANLPVRRLARPEEVARVIRFLLEEGAYVVGEVISVNGGAVI